MFLVGLTTSKKIDEIEFCPSKFSHEVEVHLFDQGYK